MKWLLTLGSAVLSLVLTHVPLPAAGAAEPSFHTALMPEPGRVVLTAGPRSPLVPWANPTPAVHAVVRMPAHGASQVAIATGPGWTVYLGCGHAFPPSKAGKTIVIDGPWPDAWPLPPAGTRAVLFKLDPRRDLSLVRTNHGPEPWIAPVAPAGFVPATQVVSVGYDQMTPVSVKAVTTIVRMGRETIYTRERPVEGRSGGGLIDPRGYLCGICQGYYPGGEGLYVSLTTIQEFLAAPAAGSRTPPAAPPPWQQSRPPQFYAPPARSPLAPCPGGS